MASCVLPALLVLVALSATAAQNVPGFWNGIPLSNPALLTNVRPQTSCLPRAALCPIGRCTANARRHLHLRYHIVLVLAQRRLLYIKAALYLSAH